MSVNVRTFSMGLDRTVLATRAYGREVGRRALDSFVDASALVLTFDRVEVASPAFLDELLLTLRALTIGGDSGKMLVVAEMNEDVEESLKMVLERRKLAMAAVEGDKVDLLGGAQQLRETMKEAMSLGPSFSASDLADQLRLKLPALHQRLKALTDVGAIAREIDPTADRGVRHAYSAPSEAIMTALDEFHRLERA